MTLEERARQYILQKELWQNAVGQPFRKTLKRAYQVLETDLMGDMPQNYRIDGKVLVKGRIRRPQGDYPYIAVFSDRSFGRTFHAERNYESEIPQPD